MRKNLRPKTSFSMNCRLSATDNKVGLSRILGREYQLKETLASCLTEMLIFRINFLNDIFYYILWRNLRGITIYFILYINIIFYHTSYSLSLASMLLKKLLFFLPLTVQYSHFYIKIGCVGILKNLYRVFNLI